MHIQDGFVQRNTLTEAARDLLCADMPLLPVPAPTRTPRPNIC